MAGTLLLQHAEFWAVVLKVLAVIAAVSVTFSAILAAGLIAADIYLTKREQR